MRSWETAPEEQACDADSFEGRPWDDPGGHLYRSTLIEYGRQRAARGAGPVALGIDTGVIKLILTHAAAVHGLEVSSEPVDLAGVALKRLGWIGKGNERDKPFIRGWFVN